MEIDPSSYFTQDQIQKMNRTVEVGRETNRLNALHLEEAVKIVNAIITNSLYKNTKFLTTDDLRFTDEFLSDDFNRQETETIENNVRTIDVRFASKKKMANILFDIYFPRPLDESYYHFTKVSALRNILASGKLRLKSLAANSNDHEFNEFYRDHNILGYFENKDEQGNPLKESLMSETYAFCMASKSGLNLKNEQSLWTSFGDSGRGVRIDLNVQSDHPDFRTILYRGSGFQPKDLLINRINRVLTNLYKRQLFISGVSKIGAFYLPGEYRIENEVRFVVKKHTDEYEFNYDDSRGYIELPLEFASTKFSISAIKIGPNCTDDERSEITEMIKSSAYGSTVQID